MKKPDGLAFAALVAALGLGAGNWGCSSGGNKGGTAGLGGSTGGGGGSSGAGGQSGTGGSSGNGGTGGAAGGGAGTGGGGAGGSAGAGGAGGAAGVGGGGSGGGPDGSAGADAGPAPDGGGNAAMPHPFGSHTFPYPPGVLVPTGVRATIDRAVTDFYDRWSQRYLVVRCGGYVVLTEGGTGAAVETFSVSEGHGYGMVIAALMAGHDPMARVKFDGLYNVFRSYPSTNDPNLMAWQLETRCPAGEQCTMVAPGCFRINGPSSGSATDGDLDIGFSLLLADRQWGSAGPINYLAEGKKVIAAIKAKEMNPTTKFPTLADDVGPMDDVYFATRPSDFMIDHFRSFGSATADAFWPQSVDALHTLVARMQATYAAATGLIPDFIVETNTTARPAPPMFTDEGPTTGEYSYNSCRVPWRLGTDYVVSGDMRTKAELTRLNDWIRMTTAADPTKIVDGYRLNGAISTEVSGPDLAFTAPFGVAAIVGTDQRWLDGLWNEITRMGLTVYFSDSIKMISMIVISGNWWAPYP